MRKISLGLLLATALSAASAAAETSLQCDPGAVTRLSFTAPSPRHRFRFRGTYTPSAGFDPVASGLTVDIAYEPEADPANDVYDATLPAGGFTATSNGLVYRDSAGSVGGITLVEITDLAGGAKRIVIERKGAAIAAATRAGVMRVVLTSGGKCVRTCGTTCTTDSAQRLACGGSTDTAFCGVRSGCELLNIAGKNCLLPYPSSLFEANDGSTATGKRLAYPRRAMPANASGLHIDPTKWNQLDGFSPGTIAMVNFPQGVDLAASNVPPLTNFAASVAPGSPTVLVDADTLEHVEHFAENDVSIGTNNVPIGPPNQILMIRPGRRLKNGGHYIVALRGLVDVNGMPISPEPAFQALRDGTPSGSAALEARRAAFEDIFTTLAAAGVPRSNLIVAWNFHTASDDALEGWLLSMRDEAFAQLGPGNAPTFTVDTIEDDPFGDPRVCRRVKGTYEVPLYTTADGPGSLLNIDPVTNLPVQNGVTHPPFTAILPCSLVSPTPTAGRPIFYGHGLLGTGAGEVSADNLRTLANTYGFVLVATDWKGMSNEDLTTILGFITDLTGFPKLSERLHQGMLNQLFLGRLLGAPNGLSSHAAFQYGTVSVIDPSEVFYYGNSQGGILGGTVMALTQETTRGVLGVPAANFSTLLQRSRDFDPYFTLLKANYPDDVTRMLTYPILQQLWDKSEPNGWYHHTVSNPLPNTPAHKVLVHMATNDDEVANIATEIMVRSMGIPQVSPVVRSYYNIPEMAAPFDGSAMLESDEGDPPAPITNVPPADNNAHGAMRARPAIQAQIDAFLKTGGQVEDFCSGPCDPE